MRNSIIAMSVALFALGAIVVSAQQPASTAVEQRVPLTQSATAFDSNGAAALEASLRTTALSGAPDAPVTNIRIVIKNVSPFFYTYVSGLATFYDASGVRCGEGLFKVDALAQSESAETDAPGLRITCAPATWRIIATSLLTRTADVAKPDEGFAGPSSGASASPSSSRGSAANLVISIDGEEHPIQVGKPMVLTLGDKQRTITVRAAP